MSNRAGRTSLSGTGTRSLQQPGTNTAAQRDNQKHERESFISEVPEWIEVEELPWKERCEIQLYKLVSLIPVSVTFCLYIYLFIYYTAVSMLPSASIVVLMCNNNMRDRFLVLSTPNDLVRF